MFKISIAHIVEIIGGKVCRGKIRLLKSTVAGYAFDSRRVKTGDLFFALKGEQRDGHDFVENAWRRGAVGAVVSKEIAGLPDDFVQILVDSPLNSLQSLAAYARKSYNLKCVAVTGSNGKTTTKEMIASVLSSRLNVRKSEANFNNHIGVPISILSIGPVDQVLVLEIASNHPGEIANLASIARPDIAVITNVGRAHIGFFGSLDKIAREKTDLVRSLDRDGTGIINGDDENILRALEGCNRHLIEFGTSDSCDFRAEDIAFDENGNVSFRVKGVDFRLKLPGVHTVYNALAAAAVASIFGLDLYECAQRLKDFEAVRMKTFLVDNIEVVDDTYNSNPDSVKAALEALLRHKNGRKVFVMGEMLELGAYSEDLHREVGSIVGSLGIDILIGIGGFTRLTCEAAIAAGMKPESVIFFESKEDAKVELRSLVRKGDRVLVKGSRLTGLDELVEDFKITGLASKGKD
ncbi:MAG: UDP-N-acetylmuramoyl-tripeptide--D-alanyl-D-alanine ligase [bacterium]